MQIRCLTVSMLLLTSVSSQACKSSGSEEESTAEASTAVDTPSDSAIVDLLPGEGRYKLLQFDLGALAISLDTIEPVGSGALVRLQIGNTTGAGLEDLSATVLWGPLSPTGIPQVSPARTREAPLASLVPAGKWTQVTFTFADVPPSEISFVRLANIGYTGLVLK